MKRIFLLAVALALPAHGKPVALWTSDPVRPGQTVLVFGDGFAGCKKVRLTRLSDDAKQKPLVADIAPAQVSAKSVKFTVPASWPQGVYDAQIQTPGGAVSVRINKPQILWTQSGSGVIAAKGDWFRVLGKCLAWPGKTAKWRVNSGGKVVEGRFANASAFSLGGRLSVLGLGARRLSLSVHSGLGGAAGWSEAVVMQTPQSGLSMTARDWAAVQPHKALGADAGQDADDDSESLQKALDDLKGDATGQRELLLPRGRFVLSDALTIPPGVTLRGAGKDLTALCWGDTDTPPEALIRGSGNFAVENLSIYAINHRHGIMADQSGPNAGNVTIRNVRLRLNPYRGHLETEEVDKRFRASLKLSTGGGDSLRLGGPNIEVANCDIDGGGRCLYLSGARGAWVHDNTFYNGRWGWYSLSGNNGVIFENNNIIGGDLMSTGGGLNCLDGSMVSQNVYYANNHLKRMFGWDREAMTSDAGGGAYFGKIDKADGKTLTVATDPEWNKRDWMGAGVFILDGKGQGQYRQIAKFSGREITLDAPWTIAPDATSTVTVTMIQRNYLFVNNTFEDAGVAIQLYGTAIGHIAAGNTSARTAGFHNFGMNYHGIQPSWFIQWLDNRITDGTVFGGGHDQSMSVGEAHLGIFCLPPGGGREVPLTLGCVARGNKLDGNAHLAVGGSDPPNPAVTFPYVQEAIMEGNTVANAKVGLRVARAASGILQRDNKFINCEQGAVDEIELEKQAATARAKLFARPGPLVNYSCNELKSGKLLDESGNGFNARMVGAPQIAPDGVRGPCLKLDGASYMVTSKPNLLNVQSCTLSLWVKLDKVAGRWGFVSKRLNSAPAPFIFGSNSGALFFEATDTNGGWSFNVFSKTVLDTNWHHVAAVLEDKRGVTLYCDGKVLMHKDNAQSVMATKEPLAIGREGWGGDPADGKTPALMKGSLDEIQIFPRALSPEEIAKLAAR